MLSLQLLNWTCTTSKWTSYTRILIEQSFYFEIRNGASSRIISRKHRPSPGDKPTTNNLDIQPASSFVGAPLQSDKTMLVVDWRRALTTSAEGNSHKRFPDRYPILSARSQAGSRGIWPPRVPIAVSHGEPPLVSGAPALYTSLSYARAGEHCVFVNHGTRDCKFREI